MSARTKGGHETHTLPAPEGVTSGDAPVILHLWFEADIEMSQRYGLDVKTLCGIWDGVDLSIGGRLRAQDPNPRGTRLCRNCTRTKAYRR